MTANLIKKNVKNVTLGLAQVFIDNVDVGFVESVQANIEWEDFDFEQGAPLVPEATLRIRETATIVVQHAEFSIDRLTTALPGAESSVGGTLSALEEVITLSGVVPTALEAAADSFAVVDIIVMSPDRLITYVENTDYTVNRPNATVVRITPGGTIPDNSDVVIDYTYTDTAAKVIDFGGSRLCKAQSFNKILLHHEKAQTCIPIEILAHKARATSPLNITFSKDTIIIPEITYRVFADRTKPRGQRMIRITDGSASLVTI